MKIQSCGIQFILGKNCNDMLSSVWFGFWLQYIFVCFWKKKKKRERKIFLFIYCHFGFSFPLLNHAAVSSVSSVTSCLGYLNWIIIKFFNWFSNLFIWTDVQNNSDDFTVSQESLWILRELRFPPWGAAGGNIYLLQTWSWIRGFLLLLLNICKFLIT